MFYFERIAVLLSLCFRLVRLKLSGRAGKEHLSKRMLFDGFQDLGGVYVKFLQILAMNVDFMSGWSGPSEFSVFEAVNLEYIDVQGLVRSELSPEAFEQFRTIESKPLAAGSFAQVYRAELQDGTAVIIKVLRPSLVRGLRFDLRLLEILTKIAHALYPVGAADVTTAYRQFATTTLAETDYQRELANAQWFYQYFASSPQIVIPKTHAHLSSLHILTQDFVGGVSLAEIIKVCSETPEVPSDLVRRTVGSDLWLQMEILGGQLLTATIVADYVMGDPHPGNIKLLPDNKVGLIDFGVAAETPVNRGAWIELMREYQKAYDDMFDPSGFVVCALKFFEWDLVEALNIVSRQLGLEHQDIVLNKIGESAKQIVESKLSQPLIQSYIKRRMMTRLLFTINEDNRFGMDLDVQAAPILKIIHSFTTLANSLARNDENLVAIRSSIALALEAAETQQQLPRQPRANLTTTAAIEMVGDWLARIADHDPFLYQQLVASMRGHYHG